MFILDGFTTICGHEGTKQAFAIIKELLKFVRLIVPVGLVILTIVDVTKKTINPDDKDGQKKIITRIIAAIVFYFIPVLVSLVMKLVDIGAGNTNVRDDHNSGCEEAWKNAELKK